MLIPPRPAGTVVAPRPLSQQCPKSVLPSWVWGMGNPGMGWTGHSRCLTGGLVPLPFLPGEETGLYVGSLRAGTWFLYLPTAVWGFRGDVGG